MPSPLQTLAHVQDAMRGRDFPTPTVSVARFLNMSLDFQYFLIAQNQYSQEALLKIRNIVSTLFLAESHDDLW